MRLFIALALALVLLAPVPPARAQQLEKVRVPLSLVTYNNLPFFLAQDKGYFRNAGLDVDFEPFNGSSTAQIPRLARGDVDIMPLAIGPPFFNQFAEGFNVKLIGALSATKKGWNDTTWLLVRQDDWDAKTIRAGGLTTNDVTYSNKFRDAPSWVGAMTNKAVDVLGAPEPFATALEQQHLAHKWLGISDIAPWFNETFIAASVPFARDHHDATVRFMRALLRAADEVRAANGRWTPEFVAAVAKYSQLPEATIRSIPGPANPGDGQINLASITRQEEFWHGRGLVTTVVPASQIVDFTVLHDVGTSAK